MKKITYPLDQHSQGPEVAKGVKETAKGAKLAFWHRWRVDRSSLQATPAECACWSAQ